jgi:N-methylhydantoinase A
VKLNHTPARLAADIGGTFTDLVLEHRGRRHSAKVLNTPRAPEKGMLEGINKVLRMAALAPAMSACWCTATLATNALIPRGRARGPRR